MRSSSFQIGLLLSCVLASQPVRAQSRSVAVYPLPSEARAPLEEAVRWAAERNSSVLPAAGFASPVCGAVERVRPACLAQLAGSGLVLWAYLRKDEGRDVASLHAIDVRGAQSGPVRVLWDPSAEGRQRLGQAVQRLLLIADTPDFLRTTDGNDLVPPVAIQVKELPANAPPVKPPAGLWMRPAGITGTVGGVVLVGIGIAANVLTARLGSQLDQKYQSGKLTWADGSSYSSVRAGNAASLTLLSFGGALAATGATLWVLAPRDPYRGANIRLEEHP